MTFEEAVTEGMKQRSEKLMRLHDLLPQAWRLLDTEFGDTPTLTRLYMAKVPLPLARAFLSSEHGALYRQTYPGMND